MTTIALNLNNTAGTQFTNYNFKSLCKVGNKYLGASENGLFELDKSNTDNGVNIQSSFQITKTNLGIPNVKRIRSGFIGGEFTGEFTITISFDDNKNSAFTQTITSPSGATQETIKFYGNRKSHGSFMTLEFSNLNNSDFSVDDIFVIPFILRKRPYLASRIAT